MGRRRVPWRLLLLGVIFAASALGIVTRLVYLQIINHDEYALRAREEHVSRLNVHAPRGAILDRDGYPLATTVDAYDVLIDKKTWREDEDAADWAAEIAPVVHMRPSDVLARVMSETGREHLLALGISYESGQKLEEMRLPGVKLQLTGKRFYPEADLASSLLGFVGRDQIGLAGLEHDLQQDLSGLPGDLYYERDSFGNPIPFARRSGQPPVPGGDVRLTIDRYLQRIVENTLDDEIKKHGASGGTIIVMDPRTGAILAMASRPAFKLSELDLTQDIDPATFRNRAVTDVYEPGSVMKVITMSTAIDLGLVSPNTTYFDGGSVAIYDTTIYNWDFSANGTQTATQLLQKSLNTGAVWLTSLIGSERFYEYVNRFGFGESTGSSFSGEPAGLVRTDEDAGWYPVDLATNSFGQGIAATPLQLITAVAAIANGGKLMRPYIVQEVSGPAGDRVFEPVVVRQAISEEAADTVRQMMVDVVEGVPYHLANIDGYQVAGKTGTTIVSIPGGYDLNATIASFVGFAPADDPQMIMLVKIDQPQDDPLGGRVAAPIFGELAPQVLAYLNVEPDEDVGLAQGSGD